eukprot:SAG31_NODE_17742_length_659_cov_1.217857_1_plen_37_part_10
MINLVVLNPSTLARAPAPAVAELSFLDPWNIRKLYYS